MKQSKRGYRVCLEMHFPFIEEDVLRSIVKECAVLERFSLCGYFGFPSREQMLDILESVPSSLQTVCSLGNRHIGGFGE
jgi:hypothetical protein